MTDNRQADLPRVVGDSASLPQEQEMQAMNGNPLLATLTCPNPACHHQQRVIMPTTYCQLTYTCQACRMTHTRKREDCCVFCSYADKLCPSRQDGKGCDS